MYRPEEGCIMCEDDPQFCGPFCDAWRNACNEQYHRDFYNNCDPQPKCEGCTFCIYAKERTNWRITP